MGHDFPCQFSLNNQQASKIWPSWRNRSRRLPSWASSACSGTPARRCPGRRGAPWARHRHCSEPRCLQTPAGTAVIAINHRLIMIKILQNIMLLLEGSLEVKLPTIWADEKAEVGRVREEKRGKNIREEKESSQKTEDAGARKASKVAKHCVFPMICGSGGSKSRLAKAAGAEPAGQMGDEKLHAVVARSTFIWKSKCAKQSTFGSWDVEKVHAVVARSTFPSQNVEGSDTVLRNRCSTSYDLASLLRGRRNTSDRWSG